MHKNTIFMFTTGRIIFAILFLLAFVAFMIWSYGKDAKSHQEYYKNSAKKVAIYGTLILIVFILMRIYLGH